MKEAEAIERLRQVIRRQHKALATEEAYVHWLRRYIKALHKMTPELPSEKKLETFLTELAAFPGTPRKEAKAHCVLLSSTTTDAAIAIKHAHPGVTVRPAWE